MLHCIWHLSFQMRALTFVIIFTDNVFLECLNSLESIEEDFGQFHSLP